MKQAANYQGIPRGIKLFENRVTWKQFVELYKELYSEHTLRKWRRRGLPAQRVLGGKLMVSLAEVSQWIERNSKDGSLQNKNQVAVRSLPRRHKGRQPVRLQYKG